MHLDEAASLVVMSWVEGESLTADLRRFPRAAATLERHVEEAGRWLALLHSAGPGSAGALPAERKLAGLNDALRLETARDGAFVRAVALLERYAADAAAAPHPWSWIHGDFKPDNILFGDGGAAGIDAQLRNVTSVLEDVAPFLNSLELQCALPRAWRARAARGARRALPRGVHEGDGAAAAAAARVGPAVLGERAVGVRHDHRAQSGEGARRLPPAPAPGRAPVGRARDHAPRRGDRLGRARRRAPTIPAACTDFFSRAGTGR